MPTYVADETTAVTAAEQGQSNINLSGGTPPPKEGQIWPRGNKERQ